MYIVIHSKTDCPYCKKAKDHLAQHGVPYDEFIYDDFDARQVMYDKFGLEGNQRTVPQIVVDGERIGGFTELMQSDVVARAQAGRFDADF